MARLYPFGAIGWCLALLAGCGQRDAALPPVRAKTPLDLAVWRNVASGRVSADAWKEFDTALQELRLQAMTRDGATGTEAINAALRQNIDGVSFADVLRQGYEAKLARLDVLRGELQRMMDGNALMVPSDAGESARELERIRRSQERRLQNLLDEIVTTRARLAELQGNVTPQPPAPPAATTPLAREAALKEINDLLDARWSAAVLRYGAWPARIAASDDELSGEDLAELRQKRSDAARNAHVVIPVWLHDRWWIFDGAVEPPRFSPAVRANLTPADLQQVTDRWVRLEAETWARQQQFDALMAGTPDPAFKRVLNELRRPAAAPSKVTPALK